MEEKVTRVVIHDPHGNVSADRPISPEGATEQITQHNVDPDAHQIIQSAVEGLRNKTRERLTDLVVVGRDGTETSMSQYDQEGNKVAKLPADQIGKIDGVKVNGTELPVDAQGNVDVNISASVDNTYSDTPTVTPEAVEGGVRLDFKGVRGNGIASSSEELSNEDGGTNTHKFIDNEGNEHVFHTKNGTQGKQGIPGQSVIVGEGDLPLENYVSQADDKAITPKAVGGAINMIGLDKVAVDTSSSRTFSAWLNTSSWSSSTETTANRRGKLILVNPGEKYVLEYKGVSTYYSVMAASTTSGTAEFAGDFGRESLNANYPSAEITIPDDGAYIYVLIQNDNEEDCEPELYKISAKSYGTEPFAPTTQETVKQMVLAEKGYEEIEQGYREVASYINDATANAKWTAASGATASRRGRIIPITPGGYKLKNTSNNNGSYAILASDAVVNGQAVGFAQGCTRKSVAANAEVKISVPENATHIYLTSYVGDGPVRWRLTKKTESNLAEKIGFDEEKAMSQKAVTFALNAEATEIDLSSLPETSAALDSTTWNSATNRKSVFIPVEEGTSVRMHFPKATHYAVLTTNVWGTTGALPLAEGETGRVVPHAGETHIRKMPRGAKYICMATYIPVSQGTEADGWRNPQVEYISSGFYGSLTEKARQATSLMQNAKVVSDKAYTYAFLPQVMYVDNHVITIFAGNKNSTDSDATINSNKMVMADYDIMTGEVTNTEMPNEDTFVDGEGVALAGVTSSYNNSVFAPYNGDIAKCGVLGDGETHEISIGYKHHFTDTTMTRCKLAYDNGTAHEVEFTMSNYRQMLVDMGYLEELVEFEHFSVNLTDLCKVGNKFYMVFCGHVVKGENEPLPLVLLETTDFTTWDVVTMLGEKLHYGGEIRSIVNGGKVYVAYRLFPYYQDQSSSSNGYGLCIYQIDGTALCEKEVHATVQSLPMCFEINGNVWFGHNEIPAIGGLPSVNTYPYARQQMAFYRATSDDDIKYEFSIKNPTGFNYATTVTVRTSHSGNEVANLDRLYMAFSEDRRNLNYRQINNCSLVNMTSIFGQ